MITPPYLRSGDTVGIVAPARKISEEEMAPFLDLLKSWGLNYKLGKNLYGDHFQYSGTDIERGSDFQQMLDDPDVKAIVCARGGYGSIRIIRQIDFTGFQKNPKWIAGFSDITVLHAYINKFLGTESLHSMMPLKFIPGEMDAAALSLKNALFGNRLSYRLDANKNNKPGEIKAELTGGNLSLLYSLNGTNFFPDIRNKILFVEDVDEYLYHIDRMMQNLQHSGVFGVTKGLVAGAFTDLKDNDIPFGSDIYAIILDTVEKFDFPVCFDFPAGHISNNMTLILGREVQLRISEEEVILDYGS